MTSRSIRPLALIAGTAAALVLPACGGSDDAENEGAETETETDDSAAEGTEQDDAAAEPETIEVEHAQGTTTVPVNPETVITFDLAALDTMDALGVEVAGVAKGFFPDYLSHYEGDEYLNAGSLFEPDFEAVAAAEPDMIIVANRSAAVYDQMSEIAPTVDLSLDWADYFGSFRANAETVGEIFAKQDEVAAELDALDARVAEVAAIGAEAGTGLVVLTSGGEVTAYGPGSRFGVIHEEFGVAPAVTDFEESEHGDPVSFEFILETDPDWLFVVDRDAAIGEGTEAAEEILDNEIMAETTAWSNDQVVYLDPATWYIVMSGLTAVDTIVSEVAEGLR